MEAARNQQQTSQWDALQIREAQSIVTLRVSRRLCNITLVGPIEEAGLAWQPRGDGLR